jgi:hypothetical protein
MLVSQLPPGTPSSVRVPDNEEEYNSEFNSTNTNQFVHLFDYQCKNDLKVKFHSHLHLHFVHLQLHKVIVK